MQLWIIGLLLIVISILLIYRFTSRSPEDQERARARVFLQTLYQLEQAHHETYGTYLEIGRETIWQMLDLEEEPGRFRYSVRVEDNGFVALAEADLDGDGEAEIWQVDPTHPDPILTKGD